jgi:hypothetical protein
MWAANNYYPLLYEVFFALQASEQYFTDSQFFAQDFLHVISFLQTAQIFDGRELLLPLNDVFVMIFKDHPSDLILSVHAA